MASWSSLSGGRFRVVGWVASGFSALGGMALFTFLSRVTTITNHYVTRDSNSNYRVKNDTC